MRPAGRRAVRSAAAATRAVDVVRSRPAAVAALLAALLLAVAAGRLFGSLPAGVWPSLRDSVKFEYVGWYVSRGNRLYLDAWAVKPPLPFEVTAALALAAGGVVRSHVLALLANAAGAVLAAAAAAGVVRVLTDDARGAVVAGVGTFALPSCAFRPLIGLKATYLVVAATPGCLDRACRERPVGRSAPTRRRGWSTRWVSPRPGRGTRPPVAGSGRPGGPSGAGTGSGMPAILEALLPPDGR